MILGGVALVLTVALIYYDLRYYRLPDWVTLPAAAAAAVACVAHPAGLVGFAWPAAYLVPAGGIGGGDIKLAVPLGVACALAAGLIGVLLAAAAASAISLVAALAARKDRVAHGPAMLAAAWVVVLYGTWQP
ncbi:prepilin peptidase [Corynebacterium liangguodongii]|uniref:Prepilin peptidase n=1 Tax=Corynebacterium liangguodongii TaxID=2079535 RepID=A0A2S0WEC9_9CORY|nr:prepilin peptidase [Corynebacterium liangguodongii]AWB84100.1 prepilin peptidase [Corynebacterium liangguodongii]PWC00111.1 prepilin peptidase [Corynebacterium liangguodongii]